MTDELLVLPRFNGPPGSANGGFVAGRLASFLPFGAAVRVTLRTPPPLDVSLTVSGRDPVTVHDGETLVAEAALVDAADLGPAVAPVDFATASAAMERFEGLAAHPFPTCFVCGPARPEHDGLGLFAGAVAADPGYTATAFRPRSDLTQLAVGTGTQPIIGPEIVWAALDCPGGWAIGLPGRPAVLGRMAARVTDLPSVGEECVVVGRLDGWDGRKAFTRTTAYGADGRELGRAAATWIEITRP